ncbi:MAG: arginine repressor [Saccharofermentanales bacterium]
MKYNKKNRQKMILAIIEKEKVTTQEELVDFLRKQNWQVTQATISRDIKELGLNKVSDDGSTQKYTPNKKSGDATESRLIAVFSQAVVSYDSASNIVIIKTLPGMAPASASAIDSMKFSEVLGTIAGDDTIFIATKSAILANHLVDRIKNMIIES